MNPESQFIMISGKEFKRSAIFDIFIHTKLVTSVIQIIFGHSPSPANSYWHQGLKDYKTKNIKPSLIFVIARIPFNKVFDPGLNIELRLIPEIINQARDVCM